jgi:hypothetical protein
MAERLHKDGIGVVIGIAAAGMEISPCSRMQPIAVAGRR